VRYKTRMATNEKEITTSELAARYGVGQSTARGWCTQGLLPNARQVQEARGTVWYVPERDLVGFVPPRRGPKTKTHAEPKRRAA
jgi:hypothetical protein